MFAGRSSVSIALALSVTSSLCSISAWAYDPQTAPHDNSGRRIAVVVPGMPHPGVLPSIKPHGTAVPIPAGAAHSWDNGSKQSANGSAKPTISSIATPIKLSPETRAALEKGAYAAQGLSRIAMKRVSDVGTWVAILWRQMNDVPTMTPAVSPAEVPQITPDQMRPLHEVAPDEKTQLVYTSEHRIKTVTGR